MSDLAPWLLGIGGYAGLALSLLFFNLYPNTFITAIPLVVISPIIGAGVLYGFFVLVSLWLQFTIMVFQSMLNNQLIFLMITSLFISGEIAIIGFILYKEITTKRVEAEVEEETDAEVEEEEEEETDAEEEEEEEEETDAETEEEEEAEEENDVKEPKAETMTDDDDDDKNSTDSMPGLISLADAAQLGLSLGPGLSVLSPSVLGPSVLGPSVLGPSVLSPSGLTPLPVVPELLQPIEVPSQNVMPTESLGETPAEATAEAPAEATAEATAEAPAEATAEAPAEASTI